jgi:chromosomal replication initiation ATPase DnaA
VLPSQASLRPAEPGDDIQGEATLHGESAPGPAVAPRGRRRVAGWRLADQLVAYALRGILPAGDASATAGSATVAPSPPLPLPFNPVVFVGPPGSGKSRLMGDLFMRHSRRPAAGGSAEVACLWDGRTLGREITAALAADTLPRLHSRFTGPRLAILDGVEQIAAWDAQRCLSLLIDAAVAAGTTVVATLRMHPLVCPGLEPSLASRLSGGLIVAVPGPGQSAVVQRRGGETSPPPSLRRIMGVAARRHGIAVADLAGPSRRRTVALARAEAMYLARVLTDRTLGGIGAGLGGRDHTTVLHGIRVVERLRSRDPVFAAEIDRTIESLGRRGRPRRRSRRRVVG